MRKGHLPRLPAAILLFGQKALSTQRCIDFTNELENSLTLFELSFLAKYFSQIVAVTAALLSYLLFTKAYAKPKRFLALTTPPVAYIVTLRLFDYLIKDVFSYCF
ncbi:hypothetical protein IH980_02190 [Patescibacteria group bacterium]|nr:hypothetical protein [Patescibacteria group bacterium]